MIEQLTDLVQEQLKWFSGQCRTKIFISLEMNFKNRFLWFFQNLNILPKDVSRVYCKKSFARSLISCLFIKSNLVKLSNVNYVSFQEYNCRSHDNSSLLLFHCACGEMASNSISTWYRWRIFRYIEFCSNDRYEWHEIRWSSSRIYD